MNNFYVYRHITKDTGIPFYVGKGSKNRAFVSSYRNPHWKNIANKHGFDVEFIMTDLNEIEAFYLENFYIRLYGRKDLGGLLVNQTDGGEGQAGAIVSDERRQLMRQKIKGKILKTVDSKTLIEDYKTALSLKAVAKKHSICIATAMKYIPKELRQLSRSRNGQLNTIRLKGNIPWQKKRPSK